MSDKLESKLNVNYQVRDGEVATSSKQMRWINAFAKAMVHIANAIGPSSVSMSGKPFECVNQTSCARAVGMTSHAPVILRRLPAGTEIPSALLLAPVMSGNFIPVEIGCIYDWNLKSSVTSTEPCMKGHTSSTYYRNPFVAGSTTPKRKLCRNRECPDFSCVVTTSDTHICSGGFSWPAPHTTYSGGDYYYRCLQVPKDNLTTVNTTIYKQYCGVPGFNKYMYKGFVPAVQHSSERTEQYSYDPNVLVYRFYHLRKNRSYHLVLTLFDDTIPTDHRDKNPPDTPGNFEAHSNGPNSVILSWDTVDDELDYYMIEYAPRYAHSSATKLVKPDQSETVIEGLSPGTQYQFRLLCTDWFGNKSDWTAYEYATPGSSAAPPVTPPSNMQAGRGPNNVVLSWENVPGATRYDVFYRNYASGSWLFLGNTNQLSYTDESSRHRSYCVVAVHASGQRSSASRVVTNAPSSSITLPTPNITVAQDSSGDYTRISDALRAASHGDIILVKKGVYSENITLENGTKVIGEHPCDVIIQPATNTECIRIGTSCSLDNITVSGKCGNVGIYMLSGSELGSNGPVIVSRFADGVVMSGDGISLHTSGVHDCMRGIIVDGNNNTLTSLHVTQCRTGLLVRKKCNYTNVYHGSFDECKIGVYIMARDMRRVTLRGVLFTYDDSGIVLQDTDVDCAVQNSIFVTCRHGVVANGDGLVSVTNCDIDACSSGIIATGYADVTVANTSFVGCSLGCSGDGSSDVSVVTCNFYSCNTDLHLCESEEITNYNPNYTGGSRFAFSYEPDDDSMLIGNGSNLIGSMHNIGHTGGWFADQAFVEEPAVVKCEFGLPVSNESACTSGAFDTHASGGNEDASAHASTAFVYMPRSGRLHSKISVSALNTMETDGGSAHKKSLILEHDLLIPTSSPGRFSYDLTRCIFDRGNRCTKKASRESVAEHGAYPHEFWCSHGCSNKSCPWYENVTSSGAISLNIGRKQGAEARCCEIFIIEQHAERDIGYGEDHVLPEELGNTIPDNYIGVSSVPWPNLWTGGCWNRADFNPDNEYVHDGFFPTKSRTWMPTGQLASVTSSGDPLVCYRYDSHIYRSWKYQGNWYSSALPPLTMRFPATPNYAMFWSKDGSQFFWTDNRNDPAAVHTTGYMVTGGSDAFRSSRDCSTVDQMTAVPITPTGGTYNHDIISVMNMIPSPDGTKVFFTGETEYTYGGTTYRQFNLYVMDNTPGATPSLYLGEVYNGTPASPVNFLSMDWAYVDNGSGSDMLLKLWARENSYGAWDIFCDHSNPSYQQLTNGTSPHEPSATGGIIENTNARVMPSKQSFVFASTCNESLTQVDGDPPSGCCSRHGRYEPRCRSDVYIQDFPWISSPSTISVTAPYQGSVWTKAACIYPTPLNGGSIIFDVHDNDYHDTDCWDFYFAKRNADGSYAQPTLIPNANGQTSHHYFAVPCADTWSGLPDRIAYQLDVHRDGDFANRYYWWHIITAAVSISGDTATLTTSCTPTPDSTADLVDFAMAVDENNQVSVIGAYKYDGTIMFGVYDGLWNSNTWAGVYRLDASVIRLHDSDTITSIDAMYTNVSGNLVVVVAYYRADKIAEVVYLERRGSTWSSHVVETLSTPASDCSRTFAAISPLGENDGFAILYSLGDAHALKVARRHSGSSALVIETIASSTSDRFTACDIVAWNKYELLCAYYNESVSYTGHRVTKHFPASGVWSTLDIGSSSYRSLSLSLDGSGKTYATLTSTGSSARIASYTFDDPMNFAMSSSRIRDLTIGSGVIYTRPIAVTGRNYWNMIPNKYEIFVTLTPLGGDEKIYMCKPDTMSSVNDEVALDWRVSDVKLDTTQDVHHLAIPSSPLTTVLKSAMDGIYAHPTEQFHRSIKDICAGIRDVQSSCGILPEVIVEGPSIVLEGEAFTIHIEQTNALAGERYVIVVDKGDGTLASRVAVTAPISFDLPLSYSAAGEYTMSVSVTAYKNSAVASSGTRAVKVV